MSINNKDMKSSLKEERMKTAEVPIKRAKVPKLQLKFSMKFSQEMFNIEWL